MNEHDENIPVIPHSDAPTSPMPKGADLAFIERQNAANELRRKDWMHAAQHWVRMSLTLLLPLVAIVLGMCFSVALGVHYLGPESWTWLSAEQEERLKTVSSAIAGPVALAYATEKIKTLW